MTEFSQGADGATAIDFAEEGFRHLQTVARLDARLAVSGLWSSSAKAFSFKPASAASFSTSSSPTSPAHGTSSVTQPHHHCCLVLQSLLSKSGQRCQAYPF